METSDIRRHGVDILTDIHNSYGRRTEIYASAIEPTSMIAFCHIIFLYQTVNRDRQTDTSSLHHSLILLRLTSWYARQKERVDLRLRQRTCPPTKPRVGIFLQNSFNGKHYYVDKKSNKNPHFLLFTLIFPSQEGEFWRYFEGNKKGDEKEKPRNSEGIFLDNFMEKSQNEEREPFLSLKQKLVRRRYFERNTCKILPHYIFLG